MCKKELQIVSGGVNRGTPQAFQTPNLKGTTMNKQAELHILDHTIKSLGWDSYLGPWLSSVRDEVERDITSDFLPALTLADAIKAGKAKADEVLAKFQAELEREKRALAAERAEFERVKEQARQALNRQAETILNASYRTNNELRALAEKFV
ncbi:hypothetical protein UFOVP783_19 [uncultured Caudovirales phage]|uniref:Uncharacterized protein n=1 Tax=uncultured Caudovirales phage TaxID=2100421 RepID=A0A6J5P3R4_9CAUD|nr:hypothetical protein UFOVP783_19 [uncultured Caudovirales phage]